MVQPTLERDEMVASTSLQPNSRKAKEGEMPPSHHSSLVVSWVDVAELVQFTAEPVKFTDSAMWTHDRTTRP